MSDTAPETITLEMMRESLYAAVVCDALDGLGYTNQSPNVPLPPLTVGVTHAPYQRVLDDFVTEGASLLFAGHTHGGQVRVPGMPALVTNCDIPREQAQGLSVWRHARGAALLNVSAGLGTSIYAPVRFACPPEAVVLTLTEMPAEIGYP